VFKEIGESSTGFNAGFSDEVLGKWYDPSGSILRISCAN
jgi:hypothetical protein